MIETLADFMRAYTKIKEMGWLKTHRLGPTGIGKTLQDNYGSHVCTLSHRGL